MVNHTGYRTPSIPDKKKCPSCGELTHGEATLDIGDVFLWNGQLKMAVGQYNVDGYRVVEFNKSINIPAGVSQPIYRNLFILSKDFGFPTPIGNIRDILPKKLHKFL